MAHRTRDAIVPVPRVSSDTSIQEMRVLTLAAMNQGNKLNVQEDFRWTLSKTSFSGFISHKEVLNSDRSF